MATSKEVEVALASADQAAAEGLLGQYPMAAQVLAAEVRLLRVRWNSALTPMRCNMGVGCETAGACYAERMGCPERCGMPEEAKS